MINWKQPKKQIPWEPIYTVVAIGLFIYQIVKFFYESQGPQL